MSAYSQRGELVNLDRVKELAPNLTLVSDKSKVHTAVASSTVPILNNNAMPIPWFGK